MAWKKLKQLQQVFYSSPPPPPPPPQGDGSYNESTQRFLRSVRAACWTGRACRSWNCVQVREWLSFPPSGDLDGEGKVLCWRGGWELLLWSPPELSVPQPLWWRVEKECWWGLCGVRLEDNAGDLVVSVLHQVFRQNGSKHRLPFRVLLTIYRQDSSLGAVECLWACQNWQDPSHPGIFYLDQVWSYFPTVA